MTPLYIVENIKTGQIFDFFDFTWNSSIAHCVAPYTTHNFGTAQAYVEQMSGYFVQIGWVDK